MDIPEFVVGSDVIRSTPVISNHARERCEEMGISTKIAKRIWRTQTMSRPVWSPRADQRMLVTSTEQPRYALVVCMNPQGKAAGRPLVVSVVFNCDQVYVREGETYRVVE